ncbi:MAG: hypothetical protein ACFE0P_03250 [Oceanicaulis sp.]
MISTFKARFSVMAAAAGLAALSGAAQADQVFNDDLIVIGSACVGVDCTNGFNFGFDTIVLRENNLRIKFEDTSSSGLFPSNDWQITINDSNNGGGNYFAVTDVTGGRASFLIEAGAPTDSLRIDDSGNVGFGTASPIVELHVADGDSPTLRLEQNASSGFTAQTWDLAGNETNFFVRDVTNGSKLPFRIEPNTPTNALYIDSSGNVGMGTNNPQGSLHVVRGNGNASLRIEDTGTSNGFLTMLTMANATTSGVAMRMTNGTYDIDLSNFQDEFRIQMRDGDDFELALDADGNLTVDGTVTATGGATLPDYVFEPDYDLRSLDELRAFIEAEGHLPGVPSADEVRREDGRYSIEMISFSFALLEKIEELTLYTLAQEEAIRDLRRQVEADAKVSQAG